jgi:hypothetical protein
VAIIEGTGIVAASKEAKAKAEQQKKEVKTAGIKTFLQKKVNEQLNKMTKEGRTPFGTPVGGSAVGEEGLGSFVNPKEVSINRTNFFSPDGGAFDKRNNVQLASSNLSSLKVDSDRDSSDTSTFGTSFTDQAKANIADASVYQKKEDGIYRPTDNVYDSLKGIKFPSLDKDKPTTFTDSSGDVYTSKPYTESTPGFKVYGGTDAQLIRRKDDDAKFSQPYSEASNKEAFMRERNAYLRDTGQVVPSSEKTKPIRGFGDALGAALGLNERREPSKLSGLVESMANEDYKKYRAEMRDKVFSESPYGEDVEKKYYYKDFQQPGVYRSEKEVQSYIKDRGAALTGMPSNFQGGVSGVGKTTDDFSQDSRYQSTAGNLAKEQSEPSTLQKVGNFLGRVTRPPGAEASENPLSRTAPVGGFNISQEGRDQAAINRGIKAAEATGIPTGVAAQGGVTTQAARDAGVQARKEAADKRAKNMSEARAIAARNPNVSIVGNKAVATNNTGVARAQAMAVNRKIQGKTISQVKSENKKSMQDAAKKRNEAFKKAKAQKKSSTSGKGFGSPTQGKNAPTKPKAGSFGISKKGKQQAAKNKATAAKKSKSKSRSGSKSSSRGARGSSGSRGRGGTGGKGGSTGGSKSSSRGARGSAGSRGRGGTSRGGRRGGVGRGGRRGGRGGRGGRRCDIFLKYNISPLTNMNLIRDDLAEVAYFVKEIQEK